MKTWIDLNPTAVQCGVCGDVCQRAVLVPCCGVQACRYCAVKVLTGGVKSGARKCWSCGSKVTTMDLVAATEVRKTVMLIKKTDSTGK